MQLLRHNANRLRHSVTKEYDPHPGVSISSLQYNYPGGWVVREHAHGSDQLIYAVAGVMQVTSGQHLWAIPSQFAVWIPAASVHSIRMLSSVSMRTLYLRPGVVKKDAANCRVLHVNSMLRELILAAIRNGKLLVKDRLHTAIRTLIAAEIENALLVPTSITVPNDDRARRIARNLLEGPGMQDSFPALCKSAGASVRTIQRIFRRETGSDFESWRQQARLIKAIELLVAGHSVKQVSAAVGYSHVAPFITMFRKILGVTPGAWIQTFPAADKATKARV
jgi:AraC-like DNA-binding protein